MFDDDDEDDDDSDYEYVDPAYYRMVLSSLSKAGTS